MQNKGMVGMVAEESSVPNRPGLAFLCQGGPTTRLRHRSFHRTKITQSVGFSPVAQALGAPVLIPVQNPVFPGVHTNIYFCH